MFAIEKLKYQSQQSELCLDFSRTSKLYAEGVLFFNAELRRIIKQRHGAITFTWAPPRISKVSQVLKQVGILDLLGVKTPIIPEDSDVINWRAAHGKQVDGSKYEDILQEYDGDITSALQEKLYTGITEAMTNVTNHAYSQTADDASKGWWMFSQESQGILSVVFCDLGAGIPGTLPHKKPALWRKICKMGRPSDSITIREAINESISRTQQSHRGKGLGQIFRVIQDIPGGKVYILSNFGSCRKSQGEQSFKRNDYTDSIMGTIIFWHIPLDSQGDEV